MKISKVLAGSILSSAILFTSVQNTFAEDFTINFGTIKLEIKGVSLDFDDEDFSPDEVLINGVNYSEEELNKIVMQLEALKSETDTINIAGQTVTGAQIKQGFVDFFTGPDFRKILVAQGATDIQIEQVIAEIRREIGVSSNSSGQQNANVISSLLSNNSSNSSIQTILRNINLAKYIETVQKNIVPLITSTINHITDTNDSRTDVLNQHMTGMSSGEHPEARPGVWVKGMLGRENFKFPGNKFTTKSYAGVVGIDFKVMEELILGLSFGYQESKVSKGTKIKVRTGAASLYGLYYFDNGLFTNLQYSYGKINLSNKNDEILSLFNKNNLHIGTAKLGYNFMANDSILFTPTVGIRHAIYDNRAKKSIFNNTLSTKFNKGSFTQGIADMKIGTKIDLGDKALMPYLKVGIEQLINSKKTRLTVTNKTTGKSETFKITNAEKTRFKAGAGVNAAINNVDLGGEYTFSKTKIYKGHLGTLSLRVNF